VTLITFRVPSAWTTNSSPTSTRPLSIEDHARHEDRNDGIETSAILSPFAPQATYA
jgi:hypothetical protein